MRTLSLLALLFLFVASAASLEDKKKPLDIQALKADADKAVAKAQVANPKDCTKDCLEAARKLVELADQYFTAGNVTDARTVMDHYTYSARNQLGKEPQIRYLPTLVFPKWDWWRASLLHLSHFESEYRGAHLC